MKILFCGDVVGKSGRKAITQYLPRLKQDLNLDLVIANAENAAHGFGITPKIYHELTKSGVDVFTLGNHFLDQPIITTYLENQSNIIRPYNLGLDAPGKGYTIYNINNHKILVVNIMGQLFMRPAASNPFLAMDELLAQFVLKQDVDVIVVDFHAETTSEKNAMFLYLNGKVSAVWGTHTHVPTLDFRVLSGGTAVQTDVGMCGDYSGVLGMTYEGAIARFLAPAMLPQGHKLPRLEPANSGFTLCGSLVEINDNTGKAISCLPIVVGDTLEYNYKNNM